MAPNRRSVARRDDEAMQSIVEEEQRSHGAAGQARTLLPVWIPHYSCSMASSLRRLMRSLALAGLVVVACDGPTDPPMDSAISERDAADGGRMDRDARGGDSARDTSAPIDARDNADSSDSHPDVGPDSPDGSVASTFPDGRPHFVAAIMGARYNGAWVRLATWRFVEPDRIEEDFWFWTQDDTPASSDVNAWRLATGYRTTGCPEDCEVWTARGFEPGAAPSSRGGSYRWSSLGNLVVSWPDGRSETYRAIDHGGYTELSLVTHDYPGVSTVYAGVFGSRASLEIGVDIDVVRASGSLPWAGHSQNWDAVTIATSGTFFWSQYLSCVSSWCIQGENPSLYHTYFATDPGAGGRKIYWYHQLASVALRTDCADPVRGGHTYQMLQVLDDGGAFVGFVGVEASLIAQRHGASIVAQITAMP